MTNTQIINQLETKIQEIQKIMDKYKREIKHYEKILQGIIKQVAGLKGNSKNIK